jgi:hypothetical protein
MAKKTGPLEMKTVPLAAVKPWDKNPRNIKIKDFERLKKQITHLGVYKPLVCYKDNRHYVALGGNMRLEALRELGFDEVDISIVHPKSEAEKLEYNLSDNDRAGEYDDQALAELVYGEKDAIDPDMFKFDLGNALDKAGVWKKLMPKINVIFGRNGKNGKLATVRNNPGHKAGEGPICKENRDKIIGLEKDMENLKEDQDKSCEQNREDHKELFDKIDKLRNGRT